MAMMHCFFTSATLMRRCCMNVFVPEKPHSDGQAGFPVVYLLHGRSDDENAYPAHGIQFLCEKYEFIVVMPDGARSFYTDMVCGQKYWTFISEELPTLISTMFPARTDRKNTFAAGLSMGGYGALKLGLRHPERFAKVASMSAVADISWVGRKEGSMSDEEVASIFGSRTAMIGTDDDLFELLKKSAPASGRPQLMVRCGDADILIEENREFVRRAAEAGNWQLDYAESPNDGHSWEYWMATLPEIFDFFSK
ncbi:MAG: esterase family protein [Lentisphaerae bacterium]|nr:esterase family protein [Lentisphaerota bacterium]